MSTYGNENVGDSLAYSNETKIAGTTPFYIVERPFLTIEVHFHQPCTHELGLVFINRNPSAIIAD